MKRHIPIAKSRSGLTLVEILAGLAVLAVLVGLLLPAVAAVRRRARGVMAETEVKTIETAWKQYYSEYQKWPSCAQEVVACPMTRDLAAILEGQNIGGANPKEIPFIFFKRSDNQANPVNPWWNSQMTIGSCLFYAKFDVDYNRIIPAAAPGDQPQEDVNRQIVVWTVNPTAPAGSSGSIVRSW